MKISFPINHLWEVKENWVLNSKTGGGMKIVFYTRDSYFFDSLGDNVPNYVWEAVVNEMKRRGYTKI